MPSRTPSSARRTPAASKLPATTRAKKVVKQAVTAAVKTSVKKPVAKVAKKPVAKVVTKVVKKAVKKAVKKTVAKNGATILAIAPSGQSKWILSLADGTRVTVAAAAAQSVGVRVKGVWSAALAARVQESIADQKTFTKAMQLLARNGSSDRATLERKLGSDARAQRTVATLIANGWIAKQ